MDPTQKVAIITGASRASARAWLPPTASSATPSSRPPAPSTASDPDVLAVPGDLVPAGHRRGRRRTCPGPVRPDRHPGQQRRSLHRQAVHRLHRRGLRRRDRGEPARLLRHLPQRHRRDARPGGGGHLVNVSTSLVDHANSQVPVRARLADQGRAQRGHQVAGDRIRRPRHPGQRRRARDHPHPDAPGRHPRDPRRHAPARPDGRDRRRRRRDRLPRKGPVRHRARSCTSTAARAPATEPHPEQDPHDHHDRQRDDPARRPRPSGRPPSTPTTPSASPPSSPTTRSSRACTPTASDRRASPTTTTPSRSA